MATNLKIDEDLLKEALSLGGFKTKKDTVNEALRSYIQHQKQLKFLELEGAFGEFAEFDYKGPRRSA